jgi:hypothetical protein
MIAVKDMERAKRFYTMLWPDVVFDFGANVTQSAELRCRRWNMQRLSEESKKCEFGNNASSLF